MRKTSVYLSEAERRRLVDVARLEGVSQAQVIREAIIAYEARRTADREFRLQAMAEGPGSSIADISEEDLLTGFGE